MKKRRLFDKNMNDVLFVILADAPTKHETAADKKYNHSKFVKAALHSQAALVYEVRQCKSRTQRSVHLLLLILVPRNSTPRMSERGAPAADQEPGDAL